ncbi:MAG: hypothetical protein ACKO3P_09125 [Planctomycetaceae bacterium]
MDLQFEDEDQPLRSRTVGGRRPASLPLLLLLTFSCLAALPVGFFSVCTAEIVLEEYLPGGLVNSGSFLLGLAVAGGVLLSLGVFLLAVWPQWRLYLAARSWARLQKSDQASRRSATAAPPRNRGDAPGDGAT